MSREDAYKLVDKLFNIKYTGNVTFSFFGGGISNVSVEQTGIRHVSQIVLAINEAQLA